MDPPQSNTSTSEEEKLILEALRYARNDSITTDHPFIASLDVNFDSSISADSAVSRLECTSQLLTQVIGFIEKAAASIKQESERHYRGAGKRSTRTFLPDDIMCLVLSHMKDSTRYHRSRLFIPFAHTCRRFRELAINLPSLWASAYTNYKAEENAVYLERSKNASLDINIKVDASTTVDRIMSFVKNILPHSHRWRSFNFDVDYRSMNSEVHFPVVDLVYLIHSLRESLGSIHLPKLRELHIYYCESWFENNLLRPDFDLDFYASWNTPNLYRVNVDGVIPLHFPLSSSVTEVTITRSTSEGTPLNADELIRFLGLFPNITDLSLSLDPLSVDRPAVSPICLTELQRLDLFVVFSDEDVCLTLSRLLSSFSFPKVSYLDVTTYLNDTNDTGPWLRRLMWKSRFPQLTGLEIEINYTQAVTQCCMLEEVFNEAPRLKELTLMLDDLDTRIIDVRRLQNTNLPALRSLRFLLSKQHSVHSIHNLVEALRKNEANWDRFQCLEVVHEFPDYVKGIMEKVVPKEKLVVKKWGQNN